MARVSIEAGELVVDVEGLDKLWALKSRLSIPLANVRGATLDPGMVRERKGVRAPGTHVPGVIVAGTFHHEGERVFWDVRDAAKAVVIELDDEQFARLVVQVEDPAATVDLVEGAISRPRS
jgi:hypothetical protein